MTELTAMTNTSREALVVFAENVEGVKVALEKLETGIDEQARILETNNTINTYFMLLHLKLIDNA